MKRLLCRGRTADGQWVTGSLVQDKTDCWIVQRDNESWLWVKVIPSSVGQYVYMDRGNAIYEGDIIEIRDIDTDERIVGKVIFDRYGRRLADSEGFPILTDSDELDSFPTLEDTLDYPEHRYKIIGNVFDNPELLDQEAKQ